LKRGDELFSSREYERATQVFDDAAISAHLEDNYSNMSEALAMVARCHLIRGEKEAGRSWLERARGVAREDEPLGWSRYLGVRGRFEWKDEKLDEAKKTFVAMYDYCVEKKLFDRAVDAAHMVAIVAPKEEQETWALKGIKAAEAGGFDGWLGPLWNNLGWSYEEQGEYPKMLEALRKAREYHYKGAQELPKLIADWAVAKAYRLNNKLTEARELQTKTLEWAKKLSAEKPEDAERAEWIGSCKWELGELDAAEGKKESALKLLKEAREILLKSKIEEWGKELLEKLDARIKELG
jgi:tetratricopeptide (TPR) repeat protein